MWRYLFLAVSLIGFAVEGPKLMTKLMDTRADSDASFTKQSHKRLGQRNDNYEATVGRNSGSASRRKKSRNPLAGRSVSARMKSNGHFYFNTKMNGTPVKVMVDTGATGVAINRSTARRMGIKLTNADFKFKSQTANGIAYYAAATIDEIRIGRVVVNNVRAAVLKDSSLSGTLLGMSFLRKLKKFEISNSTLILTQ